MTTFVATLAARAFAQTDAIQPRLPTLFESLRPDHSAVLASTANTAPREEESPRTASPLVSRLNAVGAALERIRESAPQRASASMPVMTEVVPAFVVNGEETHAGTDSHHAPPHAIAESHDVAATQHTAPPRRMAESRDITTTKATSHDITALQDIAERRHIAAPEQATESHQFEELSVFAKPSQARESPTHEPSVARRITARSGDERSLSHTRTDYESARGHHDDDVNVPAPTSAHANLATTENSTHERPRIPIPSRRERVLGRTQPAPAPSGARRHAAIEHAATSGRETEPTVHVSIGRVEVRANIAAPRVAAAAGPTSAAHDEYLRRRERRGR